MRVISPFMTVGWTPISCWSIIIESASSTQTSFVCACRDGAFNSITPQPCSVHPFAYRPHNGPLNAHRLGKWRDKTGTGKSSNLWRRGSEPCLSMSCWLQRIQRLHVTAHITSQCLKSSGEAMRAWPSLSRWPFVGFVQNGEKMWVNSPTGQYIRTNIMYCAYYNTAGMRWNAHVSTLILKNLEIGLRSVKRGICLTTKSTVTELFL